jgi:hypothetical protein
LLNQRIVQSVSHGTLLVVEKLMMTGSTTKQRSKAQHKRMPHTTLTEAAAGT